MTLKQALRIEAELKKFCEERGLHYDVEYKRMPELRFILVKEIAIKIDG